MTPKSAEVRSRSFVALRLPLHSLYEEALFGSSIINHTRAVVTPRCGDDMISVFHGRWSSLCAFKKLDLSSVCIYVCVLCDVCIVCALVRQFQFRCELDATACLRFFSTEPLPNFCCLFIFDRQGFVSHPKWSKQLPRKPVGSRCAALSLSLFLPYF